MRRLTDVLGQFLQTDDSIRLGPRLGSKTSPATEQQVSFLITQLKSASAQNGKIVGVLISLYVAMLIAGFIIVFTLFHEPKAMRAALGGSFLSLLVIVKGLHSVWRENSGMQIMIALLPSLSPEEAIKVVETYYYKKKNVAQDARNDASGRVRR